MLSSRRQLRRAIVQAVQGDPGRSDQVGKQDGNLKIRRVVRVSQAMPLGWKNSCSAISINRSRRGVTASRHNKEDTRHLEVVALSRLPEPTVGNASSGSGSSRLSRPPPAPTDHAVEVFCVLHRASKRAACVLLVRHHQIRQPSGKGRKNRAQGQREQHREEYRPLVTPELLQ
jgi:hypothetical protein